MDPSIITSIDTRWLEQTEHDTWGTAQRLKDADSLKIFLDTHSTRVKGDWYRVYMIGRDGFSSDIESGLYGGMNSGYFALELACALGAKNIHLLGYDMGNNGDPSHTQKHWHSGYNSKPNISVYKKFMAFYERYAPIMKEQGFNIINHSLDSELNCFIKEPYTPPKPKRPLVVVSFYTPNYSHLKQRLMDSCRLFNLKHDIQLIEDQGSWSENCRYKTLFIKEMLLKYKDKDIVYTDIDSQLCSYPSEFDTIDCDLGVVEVNWDRDYNKRRSNEVLSGTIYLGNNERTMEFVDKWIELNANTPKTGLRRTQWQLNMKQLLDETNISVKFLPDQYCQIFDSMSSNGKAVFKHYQESRKHQ